MTSGNHFRPYSVAELFCGCGGFSHGFARTRRFNVVLGNDIKRAALQTFRANHSTERGEPAILEGDIRAIPIENIVTALEARGVGLGELDCLIGGPPCQGFSQMRRSEERRGSAIVKFKGYNRLDQDPRNDLVLRFLEVADVLRPKFIVIENVPQMLKHSHNGQLGGLLQSVKTILQDMGYSVAVDKLNAADFGVPQLRERAFFLASRVCGVNFPESTHADPERLDLLSLVKKPWVTVAEAIGDLPDPAPGPHDELGGGPLNYYLRGWSAYAQLMRSATAFPYNHITRHYSPQIIEIIRQMQPGETWDFASQRMKARYEGVIAESVKAGESQPQVIERLSKEGIINPVFYRRYYWSAYTRLSWDNPALTITANANFLGSGRFTHPGRDRGITMREAARLQSFDDDFRFITSGDNKDDTTKIGVGLDMIGEAVPPLLAEAIARQIAQRLESQQNTQSVLQRARLQETL